MRLETVRQNNVGYASCNKVAVHKKNDLPIGRPFFVFKTLFYFVKENSPESILSNGNLISFATCSNNARYLVGDRSLEATCLPIISFIAR